MPGAPSSVLAPSSAPSSVLAPSNDARSPFSSFFEPLVFAPAALIGLGCAQHPGAHLTTLVRAGADHT